MRVTFMFWVLGSGDDITFWSHDIPPRSHKWLPEEAQPMLGINGMRHDNKEKGVEYGLVDVVGF